MIIQFSDKIHEALLQELEKKDNTASGELRVVQQCADICFGAIRDLEQAIIKTGFEDKEQEIFFFKHQRPKFDGRLRYYLELMRIVQAMPATGLANRPEFFREEIRQIQSYYHQNREMYRYFLLDQTYLDTLYFTREANPPVSDLESLRLGADRRLVTLKSQVMATFSAFELLQQYLDRQIYASTTAIDNRQNLPPDIKIRWTGSLSGLTEWIYGCNEMGVFNGGKMDITPLAAFFSHMFQVNLSNIFKLHGNNLLRKKSRTAFIDDTRNALLRRMDEDDENAL